MEGTSDVERLPVLFASREGVCGELVALYEYPGDRSAGTVLVELLCALLSIGEPVLYTPSMCLFL